MIRLRHHLPLVLTALLTGAALLYGPVAQLANYHAFADQSEVFGIAHFADVLSNLGFALVALWGLWRLVPARRSAALVHGWPGYRLFLVGLLLTAFGSSWYHLDPDNARLIWDRVPIALASGGLLAGVWGDCRQRSSALLAGALAVAAPFSVAWWYWTELAGAGDLRPYLLLQVLPIVLIPLWQWLHGRPRGERLAFAAALALYIVGKCAELLDHQLAALLGPLSGHTLKHLLSSVATAVVVAQLVRRSRTTLQNPRAPLAADTPAVAPSRHSTHHH